MFDKILVANRGEIAVRIIRACREMNIKTVAVFSEADRDSLHTQMADEAICIGPPPPGRSYLNISNIISAAQISKADAIHPGYGFLAENYKFAEMCAAHGLVFIGPPVEAMRLMGNKVKAREAMQAVGVPVVPGSDGPVAHSAQALRVAQKIGFPVLIKASHGGGGKGMREVQCEEELVKNIMTASTEASAAFGSGEIYLEKYVEEPRHIEIQILADQHGNIVHLGERDCSIQRRNQKIIEESPSVAVDEKLRVILGETAVKAAQSVGYYSAGTVEFLLDKHGNYYFIEMNTRIQVEHPVTEMVTGVDIVKEQIRIAAGEELNLSQDDIRLNGWSIECRINAEDPDRNFAPCPGRITRFQAPGGPGVRLDSAIFTGWEIPPHYDSMLGKLVVWGNTRDEAVTRMLRALDELQLEGVKTTVPFHRRILRNAFYRRGEVYTNFIQRRILPAGSV